jgi:hypothetical protein
LDSDEHWKEFSKILTAIPTFSKQPMQDKKRVNFTGRIISQGPMVKSDQQNPVEVESPISEQSDRPACTCELCRNLGTQDQTNQA